MGEELYKIYKEIRIKLKDDLSCHFSIDNLLKCHIVSSFSKSIEFNELANKKWGRKYSFFYTATLRGLCEDLIVLKFLKRTKGINPNHILEHYSKYELAETLIIQNQFFDRNHSTQLVFSLNDNEKAKEDSEKKLKKEWSKNRTNERKIFSISISYGY